MRVLVIAARDDRNPLSAGGDQHTNLLARQLASAGHSVVLLTSRHPDLPLREEVGSLVIERVAPHRLLAPVVWAKLLAGFGTGFDLVVEDLITGERLPFFARVLARNRTVGFWFQDNRPLFAIAYGPLGRRAAGAVQALLMWLYQSGPVLVPSTTTRDWVLSQGVPGNRVEVYHRSTVRPVWADPGVPFDRRENRFVVIANFRSYKRMEEAIEALELLLQSVPDARLTLLGRPDDPAYLAELRDRARRISASDAVDFEVGVSDERKFSILNQSKALTVHSPIEGLAWSLVEAGLSGVPVIVGPGVPPDAYREGISGQTIRQGGAKGFAALLSSWMTDQATWERFAAGNRALSEEFLRSTIPPEVEAFLKGLLST